jgi:hypothetical protein
MELQVWREQCATDDEGNEIPASYGGTPTPRSVAWWGRYGARGYMDSTDPVGPCDTAAEAAVDTFDIYGDDSLADREELVRVMREASVSYADIAATLGIDTNPEWAVKGWVRSEED